MDRRTDFNERAFVFMKDASSNTEAVKTVEKIRNKADILKEQMETHCAKHWMTWVIKEKEELFQKYFGNNNLDYKLGGKRLTVQEAKTLCFNQARNNVNGRIADRLDNINTIRDRIQDRIIEQAREYLPERTLARQTLDQDVQEISQTIQRQRMDAYREFEQSKGERVESARRSLSATPELDVYEAYKRQDNGLLAQKENLIQQAHEKNGFTYEPPRQSLTRAFNHTM
jgi:hypothetical protein